MNITKQREVCRFNPAIADLPDEFETLFKLLSGPIVLPTVACDVTKIVQTVRFPLWVLKRVCNIKTGLVLFPSTVVIALALCNKAEVAPPVPRGEDRRSLG